MCACRDLHHAHPFPLCLSFPNTIQSLKGTNLPVPAAGPAPVHQPKTLAHALSRAAASGSVELQVGGNDRLAGALARYSAAQSKIGESRIAQDGEIAERFVRPWQTTLSSCTCSPR